MLVRFVSEPSLWTRALIARDDGDSRLPLIALRALTPDERERNSISLYRIRDESERSEFAAAWWLLTKSKFGLIAVDEHRLTDKKLILTDNPGSTYHSVVNQCHVDLTISNAEQAISAAEVFYNYGVILPVEDREIRMQIANDNSAGRIDFKDLAKKKNQNSISKLCDLVEHGSLHMCSTKIA